MNTTIIERTGALTRTQALERLQADFLAGKIMVEPSIPESTNGLSQYDVVFIRSEPEEIDDNSSDDNNWAAWLADKPF